MHGLVIMVPGTSMMNQTMRDTKEQTYVSFRNLLGMFDKAVDTTAAGNQQETVHVPTIAIPSIAMLPFISGLGEGLRHSLRWQRLGIEGGRSARATQSLCMGSEAQRDSWVR